MIDFEVDDIRNMNAFLKIFSDYLEERNVDADRIFDSRLVSCELISNVLKHCGEPARFSGYLSSDGVVINVESEKSFGALPPPTLPEVFAESGRGLYIINAVSGGNVTVCGNKITVIIKTENPRRM